VAVGVAKARGVLNLTSDDLVNISTALMVRHLHPDVRVVLRMFNQNLITRLGKAVHNIFALSASALAAPLLAVTALTGQGLGTFRVEGLKHPAGAAPGVRAGDAFERRQVAELAVAQHASLRGLSVAAAAARHESLVVAHFLAAGPPRFLAEVEPGAILQDRDRLVICGNPRTLARLLAHEKPSDEEVAWPRWYRRLGRVVGRTLREIDLPVKVCTGVFLGVVLASTLVLYLTFPSEGLPHALYRTINLIASRADMSIDEH